MTLKRDWIPSPNYSSRGGSGVRLVVVHTAEGSTSYQSLGAYFGSTSSGVSSHTGIDDTPGRLGEYVKRTGKAWTQGNANPYSVSTELCAFAKWSRDEWMRHPVMLETCAAWIREECNHYGLPITKLSASAAQSGGRGVCGHVDLGTAGGGHWDPGPDFPWSHVLDLAGGGGAKPEPAPLLARIVTTTAIEGALMPDYLIADNSKSDGGGSKYAVYASGLVREVSGPEYAYLKELGLELVKVEDSEQGTRLLNYDRALRGLVKERD